MCLPAEPASHAFRASSSPTIFPQTRLRNSPLTAHIPRTLALGFSHPLVFSFSRFAVYRLACRANSLRPAVLAMTELDGDLLMLTCSGLIEHH
jgi:hypothetical protein